jgi:plastocyanin domain-containing protein
MKKEKQGKSKLMIFFIVVAVLVGAIIWIKSSDKSKDNSANTQQNVLGSTSGGQIIEVKVSNGYSPTSITAKAGVPTTLRMVSSGASGCEKAFQILGLNVSKVLPTDGTTDIDLGSPKAGTTITGTCSMGMYRVVIKFN